MAGGGGACQRAGAWGQAQAVRQTCCSAMVLWNTGCGKLAEWLLMLPLLSVVTTCRLGQ